MTTRTRTLLEAIRRRFRSWHRDVGYFLAAFILIYCVSGIALNHVDEWNPDFVILRTEFKLDQEVKESEVTPSVVEAWSRSVGEAKARLFDFPVPGVVKVYFDNASLFIRLFEKKGEYERLVRRPIFYDANALHRNSMKGWKWIADGFSLLLIFLTVTGLFLTRGKHGAIGRGKWFLLAGALIPLAGILAFRVL